MRYGTLTLFNHGLGVKHFIMKLFKAGQMLLHFYHFSFLFLLLFEVVLCELALLLSFFPNEKTLLSIPLHSNLVLLEFTCLLDIELEDLH